MMNPKLKSKLDYFVEKNKVHSRKTLMNDYFLQLINFFVLYFFFYDILLMDMLPTIFNYVPSFGTIFVLFLFGMGYNFICYLSQIKNDPKFQKHRNNKFVLFLVLIPPLSFLLATIWFVVNLVEFYFMDYEEADKKEYDRFIESLNIQDYLSLIEENLSKEEQEAVNLHIKPKVSKISNFNPETIFLEHLRKIQNETPV